MFGGIYIKETGWVDYLTCFFLGIHYKIFRNTLQKSRKYVKIKIQN